MLKSPRQLEKHIRTTGWRPVPAEVRVTNVEQIIRLFGGHTLYGRDLAVPLRELIQNASDAVRARRALTDDTWYEGKVVVTLRNHETKASTNSLLKITALACRSTLLPGRS